jgi:hypothetical protein
MSEGSRALSDGRSGGRETKALPAANLALKFALELAAVAAFALWGAKVGAGVLSVLVAIATPLVAVLLWGAFTAPKAKWRLPIKTRIAFELTFLVLSVAALFAANLTTAASLLAFLVAVNAVLLTVFRQWNR